jgi:DNA polymerase III subunit delta
MKITSAQLLQQKTHQAGYWLASDEIFLQQNAASHIRSMTNKAGFTTRQVFHIDAQFNWDTVYQQRNNRSLFDDKLLLELHFPSNKFSDDDKKALQWLVKNLCDDICLLILSGKIDAATQKTKWFNAIVDPIYFVPIWPIAPNQYSAWLKERCQYHQINLDTAALAALATHTRGNVLAADQLIQQLKLLYSNNITAAQITELADCSAQTDLFTFVDIFLTDNKQQILTHLHLLKNQGVEPILIIWALARELRLLNAILLKTNTQPIWPSRQPLINQACRLFSSARIYKLIQNFATIDLQIKGAATGCAFSTLEQCLLT